jgi:hypothetical protein
MWLILLLPLDIAVAPRRPGLEACVTEALLALRPARYETRDIVNIEVAPEPEAGEDRAWAQVGTDEHWWRHLAGVHARVEIYFDRPTRPQRARLHEQAALARRVLDSCIPREFRQ